MPSIHFTSENQSTQSKKYTFKDRLGCYNLYFCLLTSYLQMGLGLENTYRMNL